MQIVAVWITIILAHSSRVLVVGDQAHYINPLSSQRTALSEIGYSDKRAHMAEPTCEELRAMWRYSKRQSRAAEATNDLPMYRDPFSYNIWESYPSRSHSWHGYRGSNFIQILHFFHQYKKTNFQYYISIKTLNYQFQIFRELLSQII